MAQFNNSQQQFLLDLATFCNAKVFGLKDPLTNATCTTSGLVWNHLKCIVSVRRGWGQ